jgi:hypothetical protein
MIAVVAFPSPPRAEPAQPARWVAPADLTRLPYALARMAGRLASGQSLTIAAIGSSSTAGAGASTPAASYPSRLAVELRGRFPGRAITVLNRGVNGEVARDMLRVSRA